LDNDVGVGRLGVDVGDTDFAVLEVKLANSLVDCLRQTEYVRDWELLHHMVAYLLTHANSDLVGLLAKYELRSFVVE